MFSLERHRIRFFSTPLEVAWFVLTFSILPVAAAAFVLVGSSQGGLQTTPTVVAALLILGLVNFLPLFSRWRRALLIRIKRRFYLDLLNRYEITRSQRYRTLIACLIKIPFRYNRVHRESQEKVVSAITGSLMKETDCRHIFYVEGPSGSGKTTTLAFLLRSIVGNPNLSSYADRIFYFDFAESTQRQRDFLNNYSNAALENAIVMVDNFHRTENKFLREFTHYVLDCHTGCHERCLIFCSQPLETVAGTPHLDIRLVNQVKQDGEYLRLSELSSSEVSMVGNDSNALNQVDHDWFERQRLTPLLRLHYSRLIHQAVKTDDEALMCLLQLESRPRRELDMGDRLNREIIRALAIIIGLSIHRAVFSNREMRDACMMVAARLCPEAPGLYRRLKRLLAILGRSGFFGPALLNGDTLVFHERLAIHYKDRFYGIPVFADTFRSVVYMLSEQAQARESWLSEWLYALEIHDRAEIHKKFELAMLYGNFATMLHHLKRNLEQMGGSDEFDYELGVLYEKVGNLEQARTYLRKVVDGKTERVPVSKAKLLLVEAEHGPNALASLNQLLESDPPPLIRIMTRYWVYHIRAHMGDFDLDGILSLADECSTHLDRLASEDPYLAIHFLRRLYFDTVRFYYLQGSCDNNMFADIKDHPLRKHLRDYHAQFEAFDQKFFFAHYVHYNALFLRGALGSPPAQYDREIINTDPTCDLSTDMLIGLALQYYRRAREEFEVFGDKTAWYVRGRIIELLLASPDCTFEQVEPRLREYDEFIRSTGIRELHHYPLIYWFRYYFLRGLHVLSRTSDTDLNAQRAIKDSDQLMERAGRTLQESIDVTAEVGNKYGSLCARLQRILLDNFRSGDDINLVEQMADIREQADQAGYMREKRLASYILDLGGLSTTDLVRIIRCYPVVHQ